MPTTLPLTPWIFQVLVTFLALVSTMEMVLSPESAATSAACAAAGQRLELRMREGYDHGYWFIQTFVEEHLRHHAAALL